MDKSILIAGAGIGGLTLARALQLHGFKPRVFERSAVMEPAGAGLAIQPNGISALRVVSLDAPVVSRGISLQGASISQNDGRIITKMEMPSKNLDEKNVGGPMVAIRRSDLHDILFKAVGDECIRLDAKITKFEQVADRVVVHLENDDEETGAALIGCDGMHSAVRRQLIGDGEPQYSGYTSWRGICSRESVSIGKNLCELWGRGWRFGYTPVSHESIYWFAVANSVAGKDDHGKTKTTLLNEFSNWCQPVSAILEGTPDDQILKTDIHDRKPIRRWSDSRVTLLGDAAHPMTPNLGQGACQAIEDAVVLADRMSRAKSTIDAFQQYEHARIARTTQIVNLSRRFGWLAQLESAMSCRLRNILIRNIPATINRRQTQKLWRFELA